MILGAWMTATALAVLFTTGWLYVNRTNSVQASGGLAFLFWGVSAIGARQLEVATGGSTISVGSDALAVALLVPAALSALAVAGAQTGAFPPERTETDSTMQPDDT